MSENDIVLKPINDILKNYHFYIPSYQRGYRWTTEEVKALLNDLWEFKERQTSSFYCLQPIVVKPYEKDGKSYWEVIDGQQRLTTIFILLHYFNERLYRKPKPLYSIDYETRGSSTLFANYIEDKDFAKKNIDFFHIHDAYATIAEWFEAHPNTAADEKFRPILVEDTKIIWYEVEATTNSIDNFTRLNIGKIPLTDAELIKALFLRKSNFTEAEQKSDIMHLKHLKIASEWNIIENKLQADDFWYFIYNPSQDGSKYDKPRIEYLFDLIAGKMKTNKAKQYTFFAFEKKFKTIIRKGSDKADIDKIWLEVKQYFQMLEDWFQNRKLYHLIGFLIANGTSIHYILELSKEKAQLVSKRIFEDKLNKTIRSRFKKPIDEISYGHKDVKPILLLFNIITLNNNQKSNMRFPFDLYKEVGENKGFDVEHIRSQTPLEINKTNEQVRWINNMLEFYTGQTERKGITIQLIATLKQKEQDDVNALLAIDIENIDTNQFNTICNSITKQFEENKVGDDINGLGNLALLNADINRKYKNAMFPLKRKEILKQEAAGVYIPLCTKNAFMKSYSQKLTEIMYWQPSDANDYLKAIEETLKDYLPTQNPKKND